LIFYQIKCDKYATKLVSYPALPIKKLIVFSLIIYPINPFYFFIKVIPVVLMLKKYHNLALSFG